MPPTRPQPLWHALSPQARLVCLLGGACLLLLFCLAAIQALGAGRSDAVRLFALGTQVLLLVLAYVAARRLTSPLAEPDEPTPEEARARQREEITREGMRLAEVEPSQVAALLRAWLRDSPAPSMSGLDDGLRRGAVLLACLPPAGAGTILRQLSDAETERLVLEISRLGPIFIELRESVFRALLQAAAAAEYAAPAGPGTATLLLHEALGGKRAAKTLARLRESSAMAPFGFLCEVSHDRAAALLARENPQTTAAVLSHLEPATAAAILGVMPEALREQVLARISAMGAPAPVLLRELSDALRQHLARTGATAPGSGPQHAAAISRRLEASQH